MNLTELKSKLEDCGVVGAGGAGFPAHLKLFENAKTVIVNGAECEPLSNGDKLLLRSNASEILQALEVIMNAVGASEGVVALKRTAQNSIEEIARCLPNYTRVRLFALDDFYPAGDEVVLTYEVLGKIVPQGGRPSDFGVIVFNAETMYNIYRAVFENAEVTEKIVSVSGEVREPITVRVPIGTSFDEVVKLANGIKIEDYVVISGGPMTGRIATLDSKVEKTTNSILVLPPNSKVVKLRQSDVKTDIRRAFSACSQCRMCTDLCPRAQLGHSIEPHMLMRMVVSGNSSHKAPFLNSQYCCGCGVCAMFACHQGLTPGKIVNKFRSALKESGVKPDPSGGTGEASAFREWRKISSSRLIARLGLGKYWNRDKIVEFGGGDRE